MLIAIKIIGKNVFLWNVKIILRTNKTCINSKILGLLSNFAIKNCLCSNQHSSFEILFKFCNTYLKEFSKMNHKI